MIKSTIVFISLFLINVTIAIAQVSQTTQSSIQQNSEQNAEQISKQQTTDLPIILAKQLKSLDKVVISNYLISEKLDGIRAYWDGKQLVSRQGKIFSAPKWFIAKLPNNIALDGELWSGRDTFQKTQSEVMTSNDFNDKSAWKDVRYMIFDLPQNQQTFAKKYQQIIELVKNINATNIQAVTQYEFTNEVQVKKFYTQIIASGGEGIMLRHKTAEYTTGRSDYLLKYKPFYDAEAVVIGYKPGKGKYLNKVGSLKVKLKTPLSTGISKANKKQDNATNLNKNQTNESQTSQNQNDINKTDSNEIIFYIGSGLKDVDRENPPAIGETITFTYSGITKKGLPRHPRYLRPRKE